MELSGWKIFDFAMWNIAGTVDAKMIPIDTDSFSIECSMLTKI